MFNGTVTTQINSLVVSGLGFFALFCLGIVVSTWLQEIVRTKFRNGKGNQRKEDNGWPLQLIRMVGEMNQKLERIEAFLTNELSHELKDLRERNESLRRRHEKVRE